jgi:crotonobetainyl-CoA:carnitine CoA-transferase CaiB-like acyl-CoA transferase
VLEFSTAWAGPFAGRCLAFLGADVIKVEAPAHPDSWRGSRSGGAPRFYPRPAVDGPAYDCNVLFNSQNIDKRSLALDLKRPGALALFKRLVEQSDVILANFTPGVLDRLGIGYDAMSAVNPAIIVAEMPAFGPGGPLSKHQGMGKTMEPATGMTSLMSYSGGEPVLTGPALMDPTGGLNMVAAVVSALELRERTGHGSRILVPQVEAASQWIGEYVLAAIDGLAPSLPGGNGIPGAVLHDAFPCRGEDEWIAIAAMSAWDWLRLAGVLELPAETAAWLAPRDERPAAGSGDIAGSGDAGSGDTAAARRDAVQRATAAWDKHELAGRLQAAGVAAAPVLKGEEVATSAEMRAAGLIVTLDHPRVGPREYSGLAFRFDRTPVSHHAAAPLFGEHNDQVLGELLGFGPEQLADLRAAGVIADEPTGDTDSPTARPPVPSGRGGAWAVNTTTVNTTAVTAQKTGGN